jgi:hypothetical protein
VGPDTLPGPRVVVQRARAFTEAALACRPAAMLAALVLLAFKIVFGHVPLRLTQGSLPSRSVEDQLRRFLDTIAPAASPMAKLAKAAPIPAFDRVNSHPGVSRFGATP